jgi:hypothetical protein
LQLQARNLSSCALLVAGILRAYRLSVLEHIEPTGARGGILLWVI